MSGKWHESAKRDNRLLVKLKATPKVLQCPARGNFTYPGKREVDGGALR